MSRCWVGLSLALLSGCASGDVVGTATLTGLMGAPVVVHLEGPSDRTTTTDSTGAYAFSGVTDGAYVVVASAPSTLEGEAAASVAVRNGKATVPDLVLTPVGSVHGKATLDGAAAGNAGIVVFVGNTSATAISDDAGQYRLSKVPVGSQVVTGTKLGYTNGASAAFNVAYGADIEAPDLDLVTGGVGVGDVSGIALLVGQADLSNTQVGLVGTLFSQNTGSDGAFSFAGVPTGTYSLSLQNGDFSEVVPNLVVSPGGQGLVINSTMEAGFDGAPAGGLYAIGRVEIPRGRRVASGATRPVVSGDGTQLVWTGAGGVVQTGALTGGAATTLSNSVPPSFSNTTPLYQFTADRVVILTADHLLEVVSRSGGAPTVLASAVQNFILSPDQSRIVFLTNFDNTSGQGTISTVSTAGGAPVQLATNSGWGGDPRAPVQQTPQFSPDSTKVFYFVGSKDFQYYKPDVYVVPAAGGTALLVKDKLEFFQILPKQNKVVYSSAPTPADATASFYNLALDADPPGTAVITNFEKHYDTTLDVQISPDETTVVYHAVGAACGAVTRCIFGGPITGAPAPVKLGDDWDMNGYVGYGGPITITPDNKKVFYMGGQNVLELHCASISPPSATAGKLQNTSNRLTTMHGSPDGSKIVWIENDTALRFAPTTCNLADTVDVATAVNFSNYTGAPNLGSQYFAPDSSSVLVPTNPTGFSASLVNISLTDGTSTLLGDTVQFSASQFSPDGSQIFYYSLAPGISDGNSPTLVVSSKDGMTRNTFLRYIDVPDDYSSRGVTWLSNNRLLVTRTGTPAPYAFQDGVYTVDLP
jgi:hypothetical protein